MLYRYIYSDKNPNIVKINESNFISKDITGIFDSDARTKLSTLTIDKMFEGLDMKNEQEIHDFVVAFAPSLSDVMGVNESQSTYAFDVIKAQLMYMQSQLQKIERDVDSFYKNVIEVYKTYTDKQDIESRIARYSAPDTIGSILPTIEEIVEQAKKSGVDFNNVRLREAFKVLQRLKVNVYIAETLKSLESASSNISLLALYNKIDSMDLVEINGDNAVAPSGESYLFKSLDYNSMYTSLSPISRISVFFEEVLLQYPFGRQLKKNFGSSYEYFDTIEHSMSAIKQFVPSIDYTVFEPMKEMLYEISALLVNRVFSQHPEEDTKNIFTPSLQIMWVSMVSILALRLINFNIKVSDVIVKREKEEQDERIKGLIEIKNMYNQLKNKQFFTDSTLYKVGGMSMDSETIILVNNILNKLKLLPDSKINSNIYDSETAEAIRLFQENHKAEKIDGIIGPETKGLMDQVITFLFSKYKIS